MGRLAAAHHQSQHTDSFDHVQSSLLSSPSINKVLSSTGQPLDAQTRAFMEPRFGHDFSRVRVHADAPAAQSAADIGARAWTLGHDIAFSSGMYAPSTPRGAGLLAHELAHVVQQRNASLSTSTPERVESGETYEREADTQAKALASGDNPRGLTSLSSPRIQRSFVSGLLDVLLFIPRLFGLEYFPAEDLKEYLAGLKEKKKPKDSLFSDNMARACVSRETELGPYDTETKTLLVQEMLGGLTSFLDEGAIITLLRRSEAERAQIVSAVGRDRLWSKFSDKNRRIIEAMTLTAADAGDGLVSRLRKLEPAEIQDYASNTKDPAVSESVRRALALSKITAPVPNAATITAAGTATLTINGVDVIVLPDTIVPAHGTHAFTNGQFSWSVPSAMEVTKENENQPVGEPPQVKATIRIWTEFPSEESKRKPSGYGAGTRPQDEHTLRFHERAHGEAWFTFLRNNPIPAFTGTKGMLPAQYNAAVQQLETDLQAYEKRAALFALKAGDCVGTLPTDAQYAGTPFTAAICHEP